MSTFLRKAKGFNTLANFHVPVYNLNCLSISIQGWRERQLLLRSWSFGYFWAQRGAGGPGDFKAPFPIPINTTQTSRNNHRRHHKPYSGGWGRLHKLRRCWILAKRHCMSQNAAIWRWTGAKRNPWSKQSTRKDAWVARSLTVSATDSATLFTSLDTSIRRIARSSRAQLVSLKVLPLLRTRYSVPESNRTPRRNASSA